MGRHWFKYKRSPTRLQQRSILKSTCRPLIWQLAVINTWQRHDELLHDCQTNIGDEQIDWRRNKQKTERSKRDSYVVENACWNKSEMQGWWRFFLGLYRPCVFGYPYSHKIICSYFLVCSSQSFHERNSSQDALKSKQYPTQRVRRVIDALSCPRAFPSRISHRQMYFTSAFFHLVHDSSNLDCCVDN